ncbi:MAG: LVIVD repeat-containing protein, partial [Rhodospirillaceae bacterium]
DETNPVPISTLQLEHLDPETPQPMMTGCHQPVEKVRGTEIPVAWFAQGLRMVDISNPHTPKEVGHFMPDPPPGSKRLSSNDVFEDDRGLIYLMDRVRGFHILERT